MIGPAVMNVDKGEEIISALISGYIKGTGRYKFLAKRRNDKVIEWAHYVQRDNGLKENVYRGEVNNETELNQVLEIMNKTLVIVFGERARMQQAVAEVRSIFGEKLDSTIN